MYKLHYVFLSQTNILNIAKEKILNIKKNASECSRSNVQQIQHSLRDLFFFVINMCIKNKIINF